LDLGIEISGIDVIDGEEAEMVDLGVEVDSA